MLLKVVVGGISIAVVILGVIQIVPYGRDHSNPPSRVEPAWDQPITRSLTVRACFDCHSNEVVWPWYSNVAPISWLIQNHVDEGREELNFSEWVRNQENAEEAAETVQEREMPLWEYTLSHPSAWLSQEERLALIRGLEATLGTSNEKPKDEDDDEHDDD